MGGDTALAVSAIVAFLAAAVLIKGVSISPMELLFPGPELIKIAMALVPSLILALIGIFLLRISTESITRRLSYLILGIALVVVTLALLEADIVVATFLLATLIGGILPLGTNDPCKSRTWQIVSAPKTIAFLLVLLMLILYAQGMKASLQSTLREKIVELATLNVGNTQIIDVNTIVPLGITPEEKAEIVKSLQQSVPNWNLLSDVEKQRLINEYLQQYETIKEGIRKALEKSIVNPDPETIRKAIEKQIAEMPVFEALFRNVHVIFAFIGAMLYSIMLLFAEWIAFIVCLLLRLVLSPRSKHD